MSTRTELKWSLIQPEITAAIDACNNQRTFINTRFVSNHIIANQELYPVIMLGISPMTRERAVLGRVSMSLHKMGWPIFAKHSKRSGGRVFVDPRYRDVGGSNAD